MEVSSGVAYQVRPYEGKDQAAVLDLLRASLGDGPTGERSPKFFRWKRLENPSAARTCSWRNRTGGLSASVRSCC
jgi:hypothetical protein